MPSEATTTRFGLIRHAETFWNREKKIQGHHNSALTAEGQQDADHWGRRLSRLPWNQIISSDLGRAVETATRINRYLQIPVEYEPRLREQNWGQWTGKTIAQIQHEAPEVLQKKIKAGWKFCPPEGEERLAVWQRSHSALIAAATKWCGQTILIVTHEGVIKSLIYRLFNRRYVPQEPALIKSRHLHWLISSDGELQIERINALMLT